MTMSGIWANGLLCGSTFVKVEKKLRGTKGLLVELRLISHILLAKPIQAGRQLGLEFNIDDLRFMGLRVRGSLPSAGLRAPGRVSSVDIRVLT